MAETTLNLAFFPQNKLLNNSFFHSLQRNINKNIPLKLNNIEDCTQNQTKALYFALGKEVLNRISQGQKMLNTSKYIHSGT